jgi:hypothetical protein
MVVREGSLTTVGAGDILYFYLSRIVDGADENTHMQLQVSIVSSFFDEFMGDSVGGGTFYDGYERVLVR